MKIDIPIPRFVSSDDRSLDALQCVFHYFLGVTLDSAALNRLLNRKPGKWVFPSQMTAVLWDLGLSVKYFSREPLDPYLTEPANAQDYIRQIYGKDADTILEKNDMSFVVETTKRLVSLSIYEQRHLFLEDVEAYIQEGVIPLMVIDENKLKGISGPYKEVVVLVTGFDEEYVYFHSFDGPKPVPHSRVRKLNFIQAWNADPTDGIVMLVFGKRNDPSTTR